MSTNTNLAQLDFATIKQNIKTHLRAQAEFADFDFDGAAITVLIDALAYSTHYMGAYANMSLSEVFLESAQLRSSVVSRAKELGYVPRQSTAGIGNVTLTVASANPLVMQKGTLFRGTSENGNHDFVVPAPLSFVDNGNGTYSLTFDIVQGTLGTQTYTHQANLQSEVVINQKNIDTNYLSVTVNGLVFLPAGNVTNILGSSNVFFVEETTQGKVRVFFGDGIIGSAINVGDVITVEYLTTDGVLANFASGFELLSSIGGIAPSSFTIVENSKSLGGADVETLASIKHIAPRNWQAQNRCVTVEDYKAKLLSHYGWIEAINVWGGEDNIPAKYGSVLISIKPNYGLTLHPNTKAEILSYLKTFRIAGTVNEIVDPTYLFVDVNTHVVYAQHQTTLPQQGIEAAVLASINAHFSKTVTSQFNSAITYSKFVGAVDASDVSIVNNDTSFTLKKTFTPLALSALNYVIGLDNKINAGSVTSNTFTDATGNSYSFVDDGAGNLNLYSNGSVVLSEVGKHSINYTTGEINVKSWALNTTEAITFSATPTNNNIQPSSNTIISEGNVTITSTALSN